MVTFVNTLAINGITPYEHEASSPSFTGTRMASRVLTVGAIGYLLNAGIALFPQIPASEEIGQSSEALSIPAIGDIGERVAVLFPILDKA